MRASLLKLHRNNAVPHCHIQTGVVWLGMVLPRHFTTPQPRASSTRFVPAPSSKRGHEGLIIRFQRRRPSYSNKGSPSIVANDLQAAFDNSEIAILGEKQNPKIFLKTIINNQSSHLLITACLLL